MLTFSSWLAEFRGVHASAVADRLDAHALREYRASRDHLMQAMLVAQQTVREFGHSARRSLRVAWALHVDLGLAQRTPAVTLDVSSGGFSTLLGTPPRHDQQLEVSLRLPSAAPLMASARAAAIVPRPGAYRVSFAFTALTADDRERLESVLAEKVLAMLLASASRPAAVHAA